MEFFALLRYSMWYIQNSSNGLPTLGGPLLGIVLTGLATTLCSTFLFYFGFGGLQKTQSRRSGTLEAMRSFATVVVGVVVGAVCAAVAVGCRAYAFAERHYLEVRGAGH